MAGRALLAVPPFRPRYRHALFLLPGFSQVWCGGARRRACRVATWPLRRDALVARHSWRGIHLEGRVGGTRSIRREREWEWERRERQYASRATLAVVNIFAQPAAAASAAAAVAGTCLPDGLLPGRCVGSGSCLAASRWGGDLVGDASPHQIQARHELQRAENQSNPHVGD